MFISNKHANGGGEDGQNGAGDIHDEDEDCDDEDKEVVESENECTGEA
jgi:hypothetical protein